MTRTQRHLTGATWVRDVGHPRLRPFAKKQSTHGQFLLRQIRYFDPCLSTSDVSAFVVARCDSHLIQARRQLCRIREGYVVAITLRCVEVRRSGDDSFEKTRFRNALIVKVNTAEINDRLDLSIRLFTEHSKFN